MTAIPEVYSTMPNKWEKWKLTDTNKQKDKLLKELRFLKLYSGGGELTSNCFIGQGKPLHNDCLSRDHPLNKGGTRYDG